MRDNSRAFYSSNLLSTSSNAHMSRGPGAQANLAIPVKNASIVVTQEHRLIDGVVAPEDMAVGK